MFNAHRSIYWGQQKAAFSETEQGAMFRLIFMNGFMLWAKEKTKDYRATSNHAIEIREGYYNNKKKDRQGQSRVTEHYTNKYNFASLKHKDKEREEFCWIYFKIAPLENKGKHYIHSINLNFVKKQKYIVRLRFIEW